MKSRCFSIELDRLRNHPPGKRDTLPSPGCKRRAPSTPAAHVVNKAKRGTCAGRRRSPWPTHAKYLNPTHASPLPFNYLFPHLRLLLFLPHLVTPSRQLGGAGVWAKGELKAVVSPIKMRGKCKTASWPTLEGGTHEGGTHVLAVVQRCLFPSPTWPLSLFLSLLSSSHLFLGYFVPTCVSARQAASGKS